MKAMHCSTIIFVICTLPTIIQISALATLGNGIHKGSGTNNGAKIRALCKWNPQICQRVKKELELVKNYMEQQIRKNNDVGYHHNDVEYHSDNDLINQGDANRNNNKNAIKDVKDHEDDENPHLADYNIVQNDNRKNKQPGIINNNHQYKDSSIDLMNKDVFNEKKKFLNKYTRDEVVNKIQTVFQDGSLSNGNELSTQNIHRNSEVERRNENKRNAFILLLKTVRQKDYGYSKVLAEKILKDFYAKKLRKL